MGESSRTNLLTGRFTKAFTRKDIPVFPGIAAVFGPGLIWAGLSQGSGELIWWPYMVAKYGAIFVGWLFIFAFLQYWYNQEIARYTIATGEGIISGLFRVNMIVGWIVLAVIILVYSWVGGYAGASASALYGILGWPPIGAENAQRFWAIIIMVVSFLLIVLGPVAYRIVEVLEALAALASFFGMLIVALASPDVALHAGEFFAGFGMFEWPPFPGWEAKDLDIWITLIAYTGAGGIWNLGYSYWVRDKGFCQARHIGRVTSPLTGKPEAIPSVGVDFTLEDDKAREEWRKWTYWLWTDNLFGVMLNALTIVLTSLLTFSILRPKGIEIPSEWGLVIEQGRWFEAVFGEPGRIAMLILGFFFLFDVFIVAGDLYSRFVADTSYVVLRGSVSNVGRTWAALFIGLGILVVGGPILADILQGNPLLIEPIIVIVVYLLAITGIIANASIKEWPYVKTYYAVWTVFVIMGIVQVFLKSPGGLIVLTGITNMFVMAFASTFLLALSWFILPRMHSAGESIRPNWIHFVIFLVITIVFWAITGWFILRKVGY